MHPHCCCRLWLDLGCTGSAQQALTHRKNTKLRYLQILAKLGQQGQCTASFDSQKEHTANKPKCCCRFWPSLGCKGSAQQALRSWKSPHCHRWKAPSGPTGQPFCPSLLPTSLHQLLLVFSTTQVCTSGLLADVPWLHASVRCVHAVS